MPACATPPAPRALVRSLPRDLEAVLTKAQDEHRAATSRVEAEQHRRRRRRQCVRAIAAHQDLEGMGFEFKSFVFQEIQDDEGYLNALGQPKIQEALKQATMPPIRRSSASSTPTNSTADSSTIGKNIPVGVDRTPFTGAGGVLVPLGLDLGF